VLVLAKLPQQELYKHIDGIIEQERKIEEQAQLKQREEQLDEQFGNEAAVRNNIREQTTTSASAQWYFYNDAAKNLGYREFKVKWGNRRLEDHWQRASKAMVNIMPGTNEEDVAGNSLTDNAETAYRKMSREFYLVNIPFTDSAVEASHKKVELALFNMALIYKDDLKDYDKAGESFKELIKRFPASPYLLPSYYNLYGMAKDQNNQAMSDYYKNTIAGQFPESMYAKVLTNPNYFIELEKEEASVRQYYEQTYELYQGGHFDEVITRTENALKTYPEHALIPQFTYLGLLAESKTMDQKLFRERLLTLIAGYPNTEIAADAQNLIRYMDQAHPELKNAEEVKLSQQLYQPTPDLPHHFIYVVDKKTNTNQLVFNIINYNLDHFDTLNLIVEIININTTQNLISVKKFKDKQQVMTYLNAIRTAEEIIKDLPELKMLPMAISVFNLNGLQEDKSVDRYLIFYNENYQ
jgi:outer membrane protein assembly factor BamD (BamD/ComL family)